MGLPQVVLEVRASLLQVTQLLTVDSVEVLLLRVTVHQPLRHLVMELQIVEEEVVVELLLRVMLLLQFLLTMSLLLLHRVTVLHKHRLPAMGHQQYRQTDHRRRPECMVPPARSLLRLTVTELHQYLLQAMALLAFPLDRSVPERIQVRHNHQEVTQLLQHLRQITARLHLPVHILEDFLHKQTWPLAPLELLEVALLHRVIERRLDLQAAMVLRVQVLSAVAVLLPVVMVLPVLLVHRLRTTVHQQHQLLRAHLQPTEHQVLLLDRMQRQVRTMALLLCLLEVTEPQHVDRQDHQEISTLPINSLKEVRPQGIMQRHQV